MDFYAQIGALAQKSKELGRTLGTEEATKNALIMPFIRMMGYDVFNPQEVIPEFTADIGAKKGEKVDYMIMIEQLPAILIECKAYGSSLDASESVQLQRYFHVTDAPVAILTDGNRYRFYTDLEAANRMDKTPYMEFVLEDMDESLVPEVLKLSKSGFDIEGAMAAASELKYLREIKRVLGEEAVNPSEELVRFLAARVYSGRITTNVREKFAPVVKKAWAQFINDRINDRLKSAMRTAEAASAEASEEMQVSSPEPQENKIVTTEEEWQAFYLVKSILLGTLEPSRVSMRDNISYCAILADDNNRRPICRLHFNGKQKFIGLFDGDKKDDRADINCLDDILKFADRIRAAAAGYR